MIQSAAPCGEEMIPRSDFPVTPSSPGESPDGLTDENADPWKPSEDDEEPKVTIEVSDEPTFIESIEVTDEKTTNVKKVTVVVKDEDGTPVVSSQLYHFVIVILLQTLLPYFSL